MLLGSRSQGNGSSGQRPRRPVACEHCRMKHIRCDGSNVCQNCLFHGTICTYPRPVRRNKNPTARPKANSTEEVEYSRYRGNYTSGDHCFDLGGLRHDEGALSITAAQVSNGPVPVDLEPLEASGILLERAQTSSEANVGGPRPKISLTSNDGLAVTPSHNSVTTLPGSGATSLKDSQVMISSHSMVVEDAVHDSTRPRKQRKTHMQSPSINSLEADCMHRQNLADWEYHGPRSFMSICSRPGIRWVSERTGAPLYGKLAENLMADVTKLLKINKLTRERADEPDEDTARKWCRGTLTSPFSTGKAYFEEAHGTSFGIVDPQEFEEQIEAHFNKLSSSQKASSLISPSLHNNRSCHNQPQNPSHPSYTESPAWYVLRNAVFAAGSRVELAKTTNYKTAHEVSCSYLENCLATFAELLFTQTGVMAIQALAVLMYFVQGLGCPSLDHMLCSAAAGLSQSKGLHRKALAFSGLTESQVSHQSWVFWAIYCCEKQASLISDRPSAFDDKDITCEIPQTKPPGRNSNIKFCTTLINHARLFSAASKKLSIPRIFRESSDAVISTVNSLHAEAQNLESSQAEYIPASVLEASRHNELPFDVLYTQISYWGLLCHIHSVFLYPWVNDAIESMSVGSAENGLRTTRDDERDRRRRLRDQVQASSIILAQASRNIILATQDVHLDATSCKSLALFFPFLAAINIFLHILKLPNLNTVRSDISLLEVCAGHVRWVELATDSLCTFPFMKELPIWARMALMKSSSISRGLQPGVPRYATKAKQADNGVEEQPEKGVVAENNLRSFRVGYTTVQHPVGALNAHESMVKSVIPSPPAETNERVPLTFESWDQSLAPQNLQDTETIDLMPFSEEELEMFWLWSPAVGGG